MCMCLLIIMKEHVTQGKLRGSLMCFQSFSGDNGAPCRRGIRFIRVEQRMHDIHSYIKKNNINNVLNCCCSCVSSCVNN